LSRKTSTVEAKKISQLETTAITSNGETCHTNQTKAHKIADDELKEDTISPEVSKSDSGNDTQTDNAVVNSTLTDDAVVNSTQDNVVELPDQDHSQVPLKNQI